MMDAVKNNETSKIFFICQKDKYMVKRKSGQSRHKDFKTLQSYMQLSDEHVKDAYMRGLSFDEPTQSRLPEPKPQTQKQISQIQPQYSNLHQQLVQRLANGEITNETFQQAISLLKQQKGDSVLNGYIYG